MTKRAWKDDRIHGKTKMAGKDKNKCGMAMAIPLDVINIALWGNIAQYNPDYPT